MHNCLLLPGRLDARGLGSSSKQYSLGAQDLLEWLNKVCEEVEGVDELQIEDQIQQARRKAELIQRKRNTQASHSSMKPPGADADIS